MNQGLSLELRMGSTVLWGAWEGGEISEHNWLLLEEGRNGCWFCGQPTGSTNTTSSQPLHSSQMWEVGLHCQTETLAVIYCVETLKIPFLPRWEVFSVLNVLLSLFLNWFSCNGQLLFFLVEILNRLYSECRHRPILPGTHSLTHTCKHSDTGTYKEKPTLSHSLRGHSMNL